MTSTPDTTTAPTMTDLFGIDSIHDLIQELAELTGHPALIDDVQAEEDYRNNLSAYLPHGWDIHTNDQIIRELDDADPINPVETRLAVIPAMTYFDISEYVTD
jgi:hypothetical protein